MTLYADDPDVHVVFPVTDREGQNITISPATVMVDGFSDITATWLGDPAPVRNLKVPLYGLPPMVELKLRLVVPGDNDVPLTAKTGGVILRSSSADWEWPGQTGGTDLGSIGSALTISAPGSYELDLTVNATVTVSTSGDVTLWVHGTGQTLTVAGQTFTIDDDAVILIVTSPREVQSAYLAGGRTGEVDPGDPDPEEPGDTTPPTAGTLTATGGIGQVSLSVSGAADETALHATAYSFSVDGGSNFGAWQAGSSATITGLSAGTITCRHQVRDAAGNISLGATKTATVTAPVAAVSITENFTAADATNLIGKATTTGGKTWLQDTTGANALGGGQATVPITNNRLQSTGGGLAARIDAGTPLARAKATFSSGNGRMALFVAATSDLDCVTAHIIPGNATKIWSNTGAAELVSVPGAIDAGDVFELTYDGTTATVTRNGEVRASAAISGKTGTSAGVGIMGDGLWLDNVEIAAL